MHVQFNSNFLDFRYSFLGNFNFIILEKIIKITQLVKFSISAAPPYPIFIH